MSPEDIEYTKQVAREASTNNLERALRTLANSPNEDSRIREQIIHDELADREANDPERQEEV